MAAPVVADPGLCASRLPWLRQFAGRQPDAAALESPGRPALTWSRLHDHVEQTQAFLARAGVQPGSVTAVVLPNSAELITAFLAVAGTGACALLDPSLTEPECRAALARLGAATLIVQQGAAPAAGLAARALGMGVLELQPARDQPCGVFTLDRVADGSRIGGRITDAALLLFTSGSTGVSKLVPLTWANLQAMAAHDVHALGLSAGDRFLSMMPLFHLHGLSAAISQLSCGGAVIATPGFSADSVMTWLAAYRPTWLSSSAPANRLLLDRALEHPEEFRGVPLRFIRSTGWCDAELVNALEQALGIPVLEGYGLTETGGVARNTTAARRSGSVGQSSGLEVAVVEVVDGQGEIVVRGPSVMQGYLDDTQANEAAFRDGWFCTGDLGRLDDDGFLFITGRLKEMINRGGKKIMPDEVESALRTHPYVTDAVVFAVSHPVLGEDVAAGVVTKVGAGVSETEIRDHAAQRLAPFKVPRRIVFLDSIPRTATGKPKRSALAESFAPVAAAAHALDGPQEQLAVIWRRVLGVEHIGPDDDFFALGGDSLSAAAMIAEVRRTVPVGDALLHRVDLFDQLTLRSLARIVAECPPEQERGDVVRAIPFRKDGVGAPLFFFPASTLDPWYFRLLAKHLSRPCFGLPAPAAGTIEDSARPAIDAIRRERLHGPWILAGHCYGGIVAFEAALQLMAEGERIAALVLFDVQTPGYPRPLRHWRGYLRQAGRWISSAARGRHEVRVPGMREHIRELRKRTAAVAGAHPVPAASEAPSLRQIEKEQHGRAMRQYSPRSFPAPIFQFLAAEPPVSAEVLSDPRLGWQDFARAGFTARTVSGDHNSMFTGRHAAELAAALESLLESIEDRMAACP